MLICQRLHENKRYFVDLDIHETIFVPLHLADPRVQDPSWNENQQVSWRKLVLAAWNPEREGEVKGKMIEVHVASFSGQYQGNGSLIPNFCC